MNFTVGEALRKGHDVFSKNVGLLLGVVIIVIIINGSQSAIGSIKDGGVGVAVVGFALSLFGMLVSAGAISIFMNLHDGKEAVIGDLFSQMNKAVSIIVASFLSGVIVMLGFVLLIVPGIIFGIKLEFVIPLIVEEGLGPIDAIKKSWEMTKDKKMPIFIFNMVAGLVIMAGFIALGVGILYALPVAGIAYINLYRAVKGNPVIQKSN